MDSCISICSTCRRLIMQNKTETVVSGSRNRAVGKRMAGASRGTNETSLSVVNQEPTVNCGMGPQGHIESEGQNPVCGRSVRIKQEETARPSGCDLVSVTKPFATFL